MPSTGFTFPGTVANDTAFGSNAWSNPSNITANDGNVASVSLTSGVSSHSLKASNFGFSIPSTAHVAGYELKVESREDTANSALWPNNGRAYSASTSYFGILQNDLAFPLTTLTEETIGGSTIPNNSNYGVFTWRPSDVNSSNFGFGLIVSGSTNPGNFEVDFLQLNVHYWEGFPALLFTNRADCYGAYRPFLYNDRVYVVALERYNRSTPATDSGSARLVVMKSPADPSESGWTEYTKADLSGLMSSQPRSNFAVRLVGTDLHILHFDDKVQPQFWYQSFDVSTDSFSNYTTGTSGDVVNIDNFVAIGSEERTLDFVVRPNGDIVVLYSGDTDKIMGRDKLRMDYAHWNGTSWTIDNAVDAGGQIHYGSGVICDGSISNDVHFMWNRQTSTANDPPTSWADSEGRTLRANNTLSTVSTQSWNASVVALSNTHTCLNLDDSGTRRIVQVTQIASNGMQLKQNTEDGSDDISIASATVTPSTTVGLHFETLEQSSLGSSPHDLAYDSDTGELYYVFAESAASPDLYYKVSTDFGATWGTEVAVPNVSPHAVNVSHVAANIYTYSSGKKVLGLLVSASLSLFYSEVTLEEPAFLPYYGKVNDARKRNTLLRM